ncbi:MAG: hypothetical protein U1F43_09215 [Myxococcota bacterium]
MRLLSDRRLVILRDGFVETSGRLFVGAIPRDGEDVELTPIALDEEGFPFSVSQLDVDARDRLYTIGQELVSYPLCGADAPARPRTRLRVFAPPHADAASPGSPSAALLHDEGGLARSFEAVTALHVEETAAETSPASRSW